MQSEKVKISSSSDCMVLAARAKYPNHEDLFTQENDMESFFPKMTVSNVKKMFNKNNL
jgi:hypothetical protein